MDHYFADMEKEFKIAASSEITNELDDTYSNVILHTVHFH